MTFCIIQQQVVGQETFTAELSGDDELTPVNTEANGTITIQGNNQSLNYQLALSDMTNVTAAHIHFGNDDENGKVAVSLLKSDSPSGLEVETLGGNFTDDDVHHVGRSRTRCKNQSHLILHRVKCLYYIGNMCN